MHRSLLLINIVCRAGGCVGLIRRASRCLAQRKGIERERSSASVRFPGLHAERDAAAIVSFQREAVPIDCGRSCSKLANPFLSALPLAFSAPKSDSVVATRLYEAKSSINAITLMLLMYIPALVYGLRLLRLRTSRESRGMHGSPGLKCGILGALIVSGFFSTVFLSYLSSSMSMVFLLVHRTSSHTRF